MHMQNEFKTDLEMDFQNLISCIRCHEEEGNVDVIIATLKTVVNICSEEEVGKDAFRDVGGLDFLIEFLTNTDQLDILEYTLKVLAFLVDRNVHNQMHLTEKKVFRVLQAIFEKKTYPDSVLKNAILLFSTILYQNRCAQDLISEDDCLHSLINYYKCQLPTTCKNPIEDEDYLEIWLSVNSALCFAVNNPRNEKNQKICSILFPLALRAIKTSSSATVIDAASSFLSSCIADNDCNQDAFAECDGLIVLKCTLTQNFEQVQSYMKECNNIISKTTLQIMNSLIGVVSASVSDHGKNASLCGKLGIISLMIDFLSTEVLDSCLQKKIILTLGNCIDACSDNRFIILDVPHFDTLLKKNLDIDDEELHFATKYLLQVCLSKGDMKAECYLNDEMNHQSYSSDSFHKRFQNDKGMNFKLQNSNHILTNVGRSDGQKQGVFQFCKEGNSIKTLNLHDKISALEEKINRLNALNAKLNYKTVNIAETFEHLSQSSSQDEWNNQAVLTPMETDNDFANIKKYLSEDDENSKYNSSDMSLRSAGHLYRLGKSRQRECDQNSVKVKVADKDTNKETCVTFQGKEKYNVNTKTDDLYKENDVEIFSINKLHSFQIMHGNCISQRSNNSEKRFNQSTNKGQRNYTKINTYQSENKGSSCLKKINKSNAELKTSLMSSKLPEEDLLILTSNSRPKQNRKSFENALKDVSNSTDTVVNKISLESLPIKSSDTRRCDKISEFVRNQSTILNSSNNIKHQDTEKGNLSDEHNTHNFESFSPPSSKKTSTNQKNRNQISGSLKKFHKSKMPGYMQVIVLSGPTCVEHKLAAHIEMLKVCPLQKVLNST